VDRLRREFKVECESGAPQVNYREGISKTGQVRARHALCTGVGAGRGVPRRIEGLPAALAALRVCMCVRVRAWVGVHAGRAHVAQAFPSWLEGWVRRCVGALD